MSMPVFWATSAVVIFCRSAYLHRHQPMLAICLQCVHCTLTGLCEPSERNQEPHCYRLNDLTTDAQLHIGFFHRCQFWQHLGWLVLFLDRHNNYLLLYTFVEETHTLLFIQKITFPKLKMTVSTRTQVWTVKGTKEKKKHVYFQTGNLDSCLCSLHFPHWKYIISLFLPNIETQSNLL